MVNVHICHSCMINNDTRSLLDRGRVGLYDWIGSILRCDTTSDNLGFPFGRWERNASL